MFGSSAEIACRSSSSLLMPYSLSASWSAFAAATLSVRQAFSQPVSRMRLAAPALTIQLRCSFSEALISPCRACARGLVCEARPLARNRAIHPGFLSAQPTSQRSAGWELERYFGRLPNSEGWFSGKIEPLLMMPALP